MVDLPLLPGSPYRVIPACLSRISREKGSDTRRGEERQWEMERAQTYGDVLPRPPRVDCLVTEWSFTIGTP